MTLRRSLVPRAPRVTVNQEFASVEAFITEYVSDISRTGVFIRSKDPLPVGTQVSLRFSVILDELEILEGAGCVTRVSDDPRGMGVVFTELSARSRQLIEHIVRRRAKPAS